ncbi:MAG: hypothetical protein ACC656_12125, partial [Candidatus Heimdallarchaeota archaeon]
MTQGELLEKISKEFMTTIYSCIPDEWIPSHGYSGASFRAELNTENKVYKNSPYYFTGERKFIHWTSVPYLLSIINSREIRLYNLQNSTDSEEFKYGAEQLTIPNEHIDHSKNYLYTFSFCKSTEINNSELWKGYGRNYQGVALEFEIINSPDQWDNIMLAPVQYKLPIGDERIDMNALIGNHITLKYNNEIRCIACGRRRKNSFAQGFC